MHTWCTLHRICLSIDPKNAEGVVSLSAEPWDLFALMEPDPICGVQDAHQPYPRAPSLCHPPVLCCPAPGADAILGVAGVSCEPSSGHYWGLWCPLARQPS